MDIYHFRKEFSLFVGELSDDVDDYVLFHAFKKKYPSCHTAKGKSLCQVKIVLRYL